LKVVLFLIISPAKDALVGKFKKKVTNIMNEISLNLTRARGVKRITKSTPRPSLLKSRGRSRVLAES